MIDFSQAKDVQIKEGQVKYIARKNENNIYPCYWKKPLSYPAMGIGMSDTTMFTYKDIDINTNFIVLDKYGITHDCFNIEVSPSYEEHTDGSMTVYQRLFYYNFQFNSDKSLFLFFRRNAASVNDLDLALTAYQVNNDTQLMQFPLSAGIVSDAEWTLSDKNSGRIQLYAASNLDPDLCTNDRTAIYAEHYSRLFPHDTDVVVDAGTPLLTLNSNVGGTVKITSIRSNFDEYKTKYDIATAGKFPKSKYPYLKGYINLSCKSRSLGINNEMIGYYVSFSVSR